MPLKDKAFYRDNKITLRTATGVLGVDAAARGLTLEGGGGLAYDLLLLATRAEPNRPTTPGFERDTVHVLRSLADCDRLIAAAAKAKTVAVVGSSFIGLEVAAALRTRGLAVEVIAPEALPFESKLGLVGTLIKGYTSSTACASIWGARSLATTVRAWPWTTARPWRPTSSSWGRGPTPPPNWR